MAQNLAFSRIGIQSEDKKGGFLELVIGDAFWDKNEDGRYPNEETCDTGPIPIVCGTVYSKKDPPYGEPPKEEDAYGRAGEFPKTLPMPCRL